MTTTDTIEGTINGTVSYRYDAATDVLYLKRLADEDVETYADVTGDSDLLLRDPATDRVVGLTVVGWWQRFGHGSLPDSLRELAERVEPWAGKVAA